MSKTKFAIIGDPISHSLSPILHNYWFKKYQIDAEYSLLNIQPDEIEKTIDKVKKKEIKGINVTLPYKRSVIPFLSKTVNDATQTHSVNTILLDENESIIGENTDVFGFQAAYLKSISEIEKKNKKALILGAGGVAPSIILALIKSNFNKISLSNRTYEKSLFLKKKFPSINIIKWEDYLNKFDEFDIVINATSLGLIQGDDFKYKVEKFKKSLIYIDTIYNPSQTKMIKHFKLSNIKTYNGLSMFIYQGQKSFYLWNKINPEVDDDLLQLLESKLSL